MRNDGIVVHVEVDTLEVEEKINKCTKAVDELNAAFENCKKQFAELADAGEKFSKLIRFSCQSGDN